MYLDMPLLIEMYMNYNMYYTMMVMIILMMVYIYVKVYLNQKEFINILISFVMSMLIMLNSGNSFMLMMLGWDLLGLTSLLLVLYYNSLHVNTSAFYIMLVNSMSDSMLIMVIMLYSLLSKTQCFMIVLMLITLIALTKSAIWPVHYWLPMAMDAPTPVSCLLHSSTLVVAGYYLYTSMDMMLNNYLLLFISFISYLMSLNYMWCCEDIKKFVAYSTMMNMSIIMMYASSMYSEMSFMHVVSHSFYKSSLFLAVGYMLMYNSGNQDMRSMSMPLNLSLMLILMVNNLGIFFVFTMSTEHLFKVLTMPMHMFMLPMLTISMFFLMKITMKLLEMMAINNKTYVSTVKMNNCFYTLILPMIVCMFGNMYLNKLMPMVLYESWFNNFMFILFMFILPMDKMHKKENNIIAPMRLDQELNSEIMINMSNKFSTMRYNAMML